MIVTPITGVFHAVSPVPPFGFGDLLEAIVAEVAPPGHSTDLGRRPDFLAAEGENDSRLPMWVRRRQRPRHLGGRPSAAFAAGLTPRPVRQTIAGI